MLRLTQAEYDRLRAEADKAGTSMGEMAYRAIEESTLRRELGLHPHGLAPDPVALRRAFEALLVPDDEEPDW